MLKVRPGASLLLAICAASLMGCGGSDAQDEPVSLPVIAEVPVVTSPSDIRLPIDSYFPTEQEDLTIQRARLAALEDCMSELGFEFDAPPAETQLAAPSRDRVFGLLDKDEASRFGYHGGPAVDEGSLKTERKATAPTPEEDRALTGLDAKGNPIDGEQEGGCLREAERRVGASSEQLNLDLLENIDYQSNAQAEADPRLIEAFDAWSACMKKEGYSYGSPWDANDDPEWAGPSATPEEIQVAKADVDCKHSTNLPGTWLAVMTAYQERLIEKNALALNEWESVKSDALTAALTAN